MEKNENGYPRSGGTAPRSPEAEPKMNGCYENDEATLHDRPLAYAYVPIQRWRMLFPEGEALSHGTLFEELYKPMEVYGNE